MAAKLTAPDYLTQTSLLRLLAVLALVVAPHLGRLPLWAALLVVTVMLWRTAASIRLWPLPPQWLKLVAAIAVFAGIHASFSRISGQTAGTALLTVMVALKLTEMRARRDVMVMISLCYFLLLTHFLFSQEIWTIAYLFVCVIAITALLVETNHPGAALPLRSTLRQGSVMILQAMPVMVALFVLFPRIPGPLWGLPTDAGAARTGLSDSMAPGDIARLLETSEVAFRVEFEGDPPPMRDRYWRGPTFWNFDGRRWTFSLTSQQAARRLGLPQTEYFGNPVGYTVTLEPHRQRWLFALDLPNAAALPPGALVTYDQQVLASKPVIERMQYRVESHTRYRLQTELPEPVRRILTTLPHSGNERTRALGERWRAEAESDYEIVERALNLFRTEKFFYTLEPPVLSRDAVDDFLFNTRRGFCEHYASSFTVLMRAAGVPARIVTGYQGGDLNELGGYFVVGQADAHAWSEVWIDGLGWLRIDPTAAVAPSRIEVGVSAAITGDMPAYLRARKSVNWRYQLEARWDLVNSYWNGMILAYGPQLQREFLSRFGLQDWEHMITALTIVTTALLGLLGFAVMRQVRPANPHDRAVRLWHKALRRLAPYGLRQGATEGPRDFAERVARERPELAAPFQLIAAAYLQARYFEQPDPLNDEKLAQAVRALRL